MNDFELFKSNVCQILKNKSANQFINKIVTEKMVERYFDQGDYKKSFYLVALVDYLCRRDNIKVVSSYDKYRSYKLKDILFPSSVELLSQILKNDTLKKDALNNAIPEFLHFNIVEGEIENVY